MSKSVKRASDSKKKARQAWPLVVYAWIFGAGLLGYFVARVVLVAGPHPLHWVSGLAGAVAGYWVGWLWYRWRGDIV